MLRTLIPKSVYKVVNGKRTYLVTLTRLKNTYDGCPRFEAQVIYILDGHISDWFSASTFRFRGHYYSEKQEAEWLVRTMYE